MAEIRLVRAAMQGDREAFARIYERYARPVFWDLVARLERREDAEDAVQAAFVAAWRALPQLRRPERFAPWLFRIARNEAFDLARRDRPRLVRLDAIREPVAPVSPEVAGAEAVRRALEGVKPASRAIVLLRVLEGWSAAEVAAAQGMSVSTVRRRYARALEHLRRALDARSEKNATHKPRRAHRAGL